MHRSAAFQVRASGGTGWRGRSADRQGLGGLRAGSGFLRQFQDRGIRRFVRPVSGADFPVPGGGIHGGKRVEIQGIGGEFVGSGSMAVGVRNVSATGRRWNSGRRRLFDPDLFYRTGSSGVRPLSSGTMTQSWNRVFSQASATLTVSSSRFTFRAAKRSSLRWAASRR